MKTSEPITKEYLDDFLRENDSILLVGEYDGWHRIFMLKKDTGRFYKYMAARCDITASPAKQLSLPMELTQGASWGSLLDCYSGIRHAFPTLDDLVE